MWVVWDIYSSQWPCVNWFITWCVIGPMGEYMKRDSGCIPYSYHWSQTMLLQQYNELWDEISTLKYPLHLPFPATEVRLIPLRMKTAKFLLLVLWITARYVYSAAAAAVRPHLCACTVFPSRRCGLANPLLLLLHGQLLKPVNFPKITLCGHHNTLQNTYVWSVVCVASVEVLICWYLTFKLDFLNAVVHMVLVYTIYRSWKRKLLLPWQDWKMKGHHIWNIRRSFVSWSTSTSST